MGATCETQRPLVIPTAFSPALGSRQPHHRQPQQEESLLAAFVFVGLLFLMFHSLSAEHKVLWDQSPLHTPGHQNPNSKATGISENEKPVTWEHQRSPDQILGDLMALLLNGFLSDQTFLTTLAFYASVAKITSNQGCSDPCGLQWGK